MDTSNPTPPPPASSNSDSATAPEEIKTRLKASYDAIAPRYNEWASYNHGLRLRYLDRVLDFLLPTQTQTTTTDTTTATNSISSVVTTTGTGTEAKLKALEIGCGAGVPIVSALLSSPRGMRFHVVGNDLSSGQIGIARGKFGGSIITVNPPDGGNSHVMNEEGDGNGDGNGNESESTVEWSQADMLTLSFPPASLDLVIGLYSVIHLPWEEQVVMMQKIAKWLKPGGLVLVNFGAEKAEAVEMGDWLGGWMFWSSFGAEGMLERVRKVEGLEVLSSEVVGEDGVDAAFLWVIAKKV